MHLSFFLPFASEIILVLFTQLWKDSGKKSLWSCLKKTSETTSWAIMMKVAGEEDTPGLWYRHLGESTAIEEKSGRDIIPETLFVPEETPRPRITTDVRDFINERLKRGLTWVPRRLYGSLATSPTKGTTPSPSLWVPWNQVPLMETKTTITSESGALGLTSWRRCTAESDKD